MLLFQLYYNKNIVVFLYSDKRNCRFTSPSSHSEGALTPKTGKGETPLGTKGSLEGDLHLGHKEKPKKYETPLEKQHKQTIFVHPSAAHPEDEQLQSSPLGLCCPGLNIHI